MALPTAIQRYSFVFMYNEGIYDVIFYLNDEFEFPSNNWNLFF